MVAVDAVGGLGFSLSPVQADTSVPADRASAPVGGVYEFSDAASALAQEIARGIAAHGGGALIVDYGYSAPGFGETLQAVANHAAANLLDAPGDADISASVDFSALANAAQAEGTSAYGPLGQGAFLTALGIRERAERLKAVNRSAPPSSIDVDVNRLIAPDEMGELFKVLAILPSDAPKPPGF